MPDRSLRAALAAALLVLPACAPDGGGPAADGAVSTAPAGASPAVARDVRAAPARVEPWPAVLRLTGELAAWEEATLAAEVPGRLASLAVDVGSRVRRGDELAALDDAELALAVAQAEAAVEVARARLGREWADGVADPERSALVREARAELDRARQDRDRFSLLLSEGVTTQSAFDAAETRFLTAESRWLAALEELDGRRALLRQREVELEQARLALRRAHLPAPFDGAVAARLAGTGDYLSVGGPVLRLVRHDPLRLRVEVPERDAASVRAGQAVRVRLDAESGGPPIASRIARTSPVLSQRSRTLLAEVELANADGRLRPGQFARVEIVLDPDATALSIPAEALVRFAGIDKVFLVLPDGTAEERRVRLGRLDAEGGRVEVLEGLAEGDAVVLAPGGLRSGQPVRVER